MLLIFCVYVITFNQFMFLIGCSKIPLPRVEDIDVKIFSKTEDILDRYNIAYEKVKIPTKDNYVLTVFHIKSSFKSRDERGNVFVYFQHGVLSSSSVWVLQGINKSLPLLLSSNGFDVWIGNTRGNLYGQEHKYYSATENKFWDFELEELASDLDSVLTEITKLTGKSKYYYVGHSMGTTIFFIYCSMNLDKCTPENVKGAFALAPVAYLSHVNSYVRFLANYATILKSCLDYFLHGGTIGLTVTEGISKLLQYYGNARNTVSKLASAIGLQIFNAEADNIDGTPVNNSAGTMQHFAQIILSQKFRRFDYGKDKNLEKYGTEEPPEYKIKDIKVGIGLYYSVDDTISNWEDIEKLKLNLSNVIIDHVTEEHYSHSDFLSAKNAKYVIYNEIFDVILNIYNGTFDKKQYLKCNNIAIRYLDDDEEQEEQEEEQQQQKEEELEDQLIE